MDFRDLINIIEEAQTEPEVGDIVEVELGDTLIETTISEVLEDGVVIHIDESALRLMIDAKKQINESLRTENPCWKGYHPVGTKKKNGKTVPNCVPGKADESVEEAANPAQQAAIAIAKKKKAGEIDEAEYQGHKVTLNKPMAGDVKKSKVYVKKPNGKVVKVNFGDKNMRIKKSNPNRRKSFRARHHCENPGPKWKARYWSCRAW